MDAVVIAAAVLLVARAVYKTVISNKRKTGGSCSGCNMCAGKDGCEGAGK